LKVLQKGSRICSFTGNEGWLARLLDGSGVSREAPAPFCEGPGVQFPRSTHQFFAWWKRHLKVYHLIARTEYGLMVQILSGLITYLLLAIYCHKHYQERVSIKRVRELRIKIQNELRDSGYKYPMASDFTEQRSDLLYAKT
jgi:hypothetical protein